MLQVPPVENRTLLNNAIRLLQCVRGLQLSFVNSFMLEMKQLGIEFLVLSLRNKTPDTVKTWHHIMQRQWQIKGGIFFYYKICDVRSSCTS